jgi:16S rRNA G1207 methylase RsmC
MQTDPWYKARYTFPGLPLHFNVPHEVFSTQRIDEGTLLFLEHLPAGNPTRILDVGCGYGALGLPVAFRYPNATIDLIDRDLLAVKWASINAFENQLQNVNCFGSLGFKHLDSEKRYDWILCNVPARIGKPFIQNLLEGGLMRLSPGGEIRVVVILDLVPVLKEIQNETALKVQEIARGPKHAILALKLEDKPNSVSEDPDLYLRDRVTAGGIHLDRPFDLGGDDQKRLLTSLPLLIDALPRQHSPKRVFCVRSGYGAVPLICQTRWPQADITAFDRDLLAVDYTERNDLRINPSKKLKMRQSPSLLEAFEEGEHFDLVTAELSSSAGERVAEAELELIHQHLSPGGEAIIIAFDRLAKEWIPGIQKRKQLAIQRIFGREGFTAFRMIKT